MRQTERAKEQERERDSETESEKKKIFRVIEFYPTFQDTVYYKVYYSRICVREYSFSPRIHM